MADNSFDPNLWKPRSVEDTQKLYADWAGSYEKDVTGAGYATPTRIADALAAALPDRDAAILDYGCGTGLSGLALRAAGFTTIDGTDISPEMLAESTAKGLYRKTWLSDPAEGLVVAPGTYTAITATGVVSLGAAPPDALDMLLSRLAPGGLLALSYNDATLADQSYLDAMEAAKTGPAELVSEAYGPHLPAKEMGSTVYVLRRR